MYCPERIVQTDIRLYIAVACCAFTMMGQNQNTALAKVSCVSILKANPRADVRMGNVLQIHSL